MTETPDSASDADDDPSRAAIRKLVDAAPPLTPAQTQTIRAMLMHSCGA